MKPAATALVPAGGTTYSASLGGGLIEAPAAWMPEPSLGGIPPLWEAASLKPPDPAQDPVERPSIPPLWEAASLKLRDSRFILVEGRVFRLFGRRPH